MFGGQSYNVHLYFRFNRWPYKNSYASKCQWMTHKLDIIYLFSLCLDGDMLTESVKFLTSELIFLRGLHALFSHTYAAVNGSLDPTLSKASQALTAASTPNLHSEKITTKWIFAVFYKDRCESSPYVSSETSESLPNMLFECGESWASTKLKKVKRVQIKKKSYGEQLSNSLR